MNDSSRNLYNSLVRYIALQAHNNLSKPWQIHQNLLLYSNNDLESDKRIFQSLFIS
jgi:hypothetical protein